MTISSQNRKAGPYSGTGSTGPFTFSFKVFEASDLLVVKVNNSTSVETTLTLTTDYTVSLNADQNSNPGGTITLVAALAVGYNMVISSQVPYLQETDLTNQGGFYPEVITDALDKLTIEAQQLKLDVDRSAKLPITSTEDADALVADIVRIADSADNLDIVANNIDDVNTVAADIADVNTVAGIAANVSTVAGISADVTTVAGVDTEVTTVAGISGNVTTVAGISANVTTVAGISANVTTVAGISADVTAVAGNNADISSVADNESNINAVAANETNIDAVAGNAANINTVAGVSANVTTVAGISANVTTVAGISADVTEVASISADVQTVADNVTDITNFADVYLGPHATSPTTRTDGSALQIGDLYFNTTDNSMKVYSASGWVNAASTVNGTAIRETFTATAGQTSFTVAGGYDAGYIDVFLNGAKLTNGVDVTVTSGTVVVLATGADAGDVVDIVAYGSFEIADTYTQTQCDARFANLTADQTFTGANRGTITSDNDLSFDLNATNNFTCTPTGTGTLTFTNITAGQSGFILLVNTGGYAISAHANTKTGASTLSTISAAGTYLLSYFSNGTNVYVTASGALA